MLAAVELAATVDPLADEAFALVVFTAAGVVVSGVLVVGCFGRTVSFGFVAVEVEAAAVGSSNGGRSSSMSPARPSSTAACSSSASACSIRSPIVRAASCSRRSSSGGIPRAIAITSDGIGGIDRPGASGRSG